MRHFVVALLTVGVLLGTVQAQEAALQNGLEVGVSGGYYRYSENPNFMELEGVRAINGLMAWQDDYHLPLLGAKTVRLEGRLGSLPADYSSASGFTKDNETTVLEGRALLVGDWQLGPVALNPYGGYGYRYLHNDLKDTATASGYTRISQYHYLPMGTWGAIAAGPGEVVFQAEYAPLLYGRQHSAIGSGLDNTQTEGSHLRGFLGYQLGPVKMGPYVDYWRVADSDVDCVPGFCGYEPKNFTREIGVQASFRFGGDRK